MERAFIEVYQSSPGSYSLEITKENSRESIGIDSPIEVATHLLVHEQYRKRQGVASKPKIHFTEGDHPQHSNPLGHDPKCEFCFGGKSPLYTTGVPAQFEKAVKYYLNDKHLQDLCIEIEKELAVATKDFPSPAAKKAEQRLKSLEEEINAYGKRQDKIIRKQKAQVYTMVKRQGA